MSGRKYRFPHLANDPGNKDIITTPPMLGGEIPVYWAPQEKDNPPLNTPTDWIPDNSPLVPVQYVWISINFEWPYWNQSYTYPNFLLYGRFSNYLSGPPDVHSEYNQFYNIWGGFHSWFGTDPPGVPPWPPDPEPAPHWEFNYNLPGYADRSALVSYCRSVGDVVKSRIEAIRPGRTWVNWMPRQYVSGPDFPTGPQPAPYPYDPAAGYDDYGDPFPLTSVYHGTNFLNIYLGNVSDYWLDPPTTAALVTDAVGTGGNPPNFANYAIKIYGQDFSKYSIPRPPAWTDINLTALRDPVPPNPIYRTEWNPSPSPDGTYYTTHQYYGLTDYWYMLPDYDYYTNQSYRARVNSINSQIDDLIAEWGITQTIVNRVSALGVDISVAGEQSDFNADNVVQLIANHYGFDKDTGKDLPPSP